MINELDLPVVMLLHRDADSITEPEHQMIKKILPSGYLMVRMDPENYLQHINNCLIICPVLVILPSEKMTPDEGSYLGFPHLVLDYKSKRVMRLVHLEAEFQPFDEQYE